MPSLITTQNTVDPPLVQTASYQFTPQERQYVDDGIRGCEIHLVNELINGTHATYVMLDGGSANVLPGDVLCSGNSATGKFTVTKATSGALTVSGGVFGVALAGAAAGSLVLAGISGYVGPAITGLGNTSGPVRVNTATGRCQQVGSYSSGDFPVGTVDSNGWLTLRGQTVTSLSSVTLAGDVTGPSGANVVSAISGTSPIPITPAQLAWTAATTTPRILQTQAVGTAAGQLMQFSAQPAGTTAATNTLGGNLALSAGLDNGITADSAHFHAAVLALSGGAEVCRFNVDGNGQNYIDFTHSGVTTGIILGTGLNLRCQTANMLFDLGTANTAVFRDNNVGTALSVIANATGTTSLTYGAAVTTAQVTQSGNGASGGTAAPITLAPQLSATSGNSTAGSIVGVFGAINGSGAANSVAGLRLQQAGGGVVVHAGPYPGAPTTDGAIYLGSSACSQPGSTNYAIVFDAGSLFFNAFTGGQILFGFSGGANSLTLSAGQLQMGVAVATLGWGATTALPTITQAIQASDVSTNNLIISPQTPFASATGTHRNPGSLLVNLAAPVSGGADAQLAIQVAGVTFAAFQRYNVTAGTGAIYLGTASTAPTVSNFSFYSDGTNGILNAASQGILRVANAATGPLAWGSASLQLCSDATFSWGGGIGVVGIGNRNTAPTSNPTAGGILYAEAGAGKWRGSSGTITTFGPSDPHCPVCGFDYMHEWENTKYGYLAICINCLTNEIGNRPWILREKQ
jgi:hypothetical protein